MLSAYIQYLKKIWLFIVLYVVLTKIPYYIYNPEMNVVSKQFLMHFSFATLCMVASFFVRCFFMIIIVRLYLSKDIKVNRLLEDFKDNFINLLALYLLGNLPTTLIIILSLFSINLPNYVMIVTNSFFMLFFWNILLPIILTTRNLEDEDFSKIIARLFKRHSQLVKAYILSSAALSLFGIVMSEYFRRDINRMIAEVIGISYYLVVLFVCTYMIHCSLYSVEKGLSNNSEYTTA